MADAPLDVAVLCSGRSVRLEGLLADDRAGDVYEVVCGFVDVADGPAADLLAARDVPVEVRDLQAWLARRGADLSDVDARREFDRATADHLAKFEPDVVVLCGYLHVLTRPFLDAFQPRIVSAHHADLTLVDETGRPRYGGLRSVRDALVDGRSATRETSHVVTEEVDAGPPICRSEPYRVHVDLVEDALKADDEAVLDAYAYAHREWMVRRAGGRVLAKTLELLADGRLDLGVDAVEIDGEPGIYQLGEGVKR